MRLTVSSALRLAALAAIVFFAVNGGHVRAAAQTLVGGIDLHNLDRTCKPCTDFYQFANGGWMKKNPIPPAYSRWGNFSVVQRRNRAALQRILDKAAAANASSGTNEQKIGDFYASCLNVSGIEQAGTTPLGEQFRTIDALTDSTQLPATLAQLQLDGVSGFFSMRGGADAKDSTSIIAQLGQGGLGLPDRDYYTKPDDRSKALRDGYLAHVTGMFGLLGESSDDAALDSASVMSIETALAQASLTRVQRRDPNATYHKMSMADLTGLMPNFDWAAYFQASGVDPTNVNVSSPDYFRALSTELSNATAAQLRAYLRWHLVHAYADALPKAFVDANFAFYSKELQGTPQPLPRTQQCIAATDGALGEALGPFYIQQNFSPAAKAAALAMVQNIKATLRDDFSTLDWMTPQTRTLAVAKLDAFDLKIGYPTKWRDYSTLPIVRDPYAVNVLASNVFEVRRNYDKIGKPVDRAEWGMSVPTVNAYYNPSINEIVFPAGILQPPFFNAKADMAVNYGAIGAVVGHESTHGFDDQGHLYDLNGNLTNSWTPQDSAAFDRRAQCVVDQWSALSPISGTDEIGKQVEGEEIADLGGVTIAYKAFEKWQAKHPRRTIDGFTPEQRFFMGWAQVWASQTRPDEIRYLAANDVHGYDKFRVNATLSNIPGFASAWFCKLNDAMVRPPAQRCRIW
ncbi:MAG TPA: M13 family metallopeptidase [Verrucomicrobiae bacterium]|jgi:putative endopeptidase|nr:M13 family metallopeptidase [Verrucomicrobiae bacterium]